MSSPIIQVENLCKDYVISHQGGTENYQTLRDTVSSWFKKSKIKNHASSRGLEIFHALKDVSFEVQQGEVLGIIGRNGAGKSTLLKILSRITEPTHGKVRLRGRVASLLEVGTGFHGELTGRENIFLNGAILGMTRAEIKKKFDEIVDFSGVEKFLDTPVKRYSSGMYVRLAFAVAAHLEPEILIVDEVLAVGDAAFQKKCLGKMKDVSRSEGRTVIFVSHNLDAVLQLCRSAILLERGRLADFGPTDRVLRSYLDQNQANQNYVAPAAKAAGIIRVTTLTPSDSSRDLVFDIEFRGPAPLRRATLGVVIYSMQDVPLFGSNTLFHPWQSAPEFGSKGVARLTIRDVPLWTGTYKASFWLSEGTTLVDAVAEAACFEIVSDHLPVGAPPAKDIGAVHVNGEWTRLN